MKKVSYLFFALLILSFISCKKEEPKDEPEIPEPTPTPITVTDKDGNVYNTITIGTQVWMVENLKVTKYNDGTPIPNVTSNTAWAALTTGAYCDYNNDAANGTKYGKLYNWYAINTGKLAPEGWHVPTDAEWMTFESYIASKFGSSGTEAKALAAKTDWKATTSAGSPGNDLSINNSIGFSALPGGYRGAENGFFNALEMNSSWWSTDGFSTGAWGRYLSFNMADLSGYSSLKGNGMSVRCIKD